MKNDRLKLFRRGTLAALRIRELAGIGLARPISVIDFVEERGVEVRLVDIPSMEGMYSADPGPFILISTDRPSGRQAFTCAHEFGHHVFGHRIKVDELSDRSQDRLSFNPQEFLVDCFAGALLMPRPLLNLAFGVRGRSALTAEAQDMYCVSGMLGVSYEALLRHLTGVGMLPKAQSSRLLTQSPSLLKRELLGKVHSGDLFIVDTSWIGRPVDLRIGDAVILMEGISGAEAFLRCEPSCCKLGRVFIAAHEGIGELRHASRDWAAYVRVSPERFVGRAKFRHLEKRSGD